MPLADRLIQVTIPLPDGPVTVTGERTDCPYLAIAPGFAKDGVSGLLVLTHIPTGRRLPVLPIEKERLRKLAAAVAHLDWDFTDPAGFTAETRDGFLKARREIEGAEGEEIFTEYPKNWGRGEDALPGDADAMVKWLLDGWQATHDQMHNRDHPRKISMDGPDGKPNWEWIAGSIRQVDVFGMAYLLAALRRVAPDVADHATAFLAEQWAAGDSIGEWVWQWQDELRKGEPLRLPAVPSPEPADGEFLS
jgi:hypothetical protein